MDIKGLSVYEAGALKETRSPQWWKHLREWKQVFWKSERQAHKKAIKKEN